MDKSDPETYSEEEANVRFDVAVKRMLATPHKKQKDTKSSGLLKRGRPKGSSHG